MRKRAGKILKHAVLFACIIGLGFPVHTQSLKVDPAIAPALQEWKDMGFGVFIHWTPAVAFQSRYKDIEVNKDLWGEWFMYRTGIPVKEYEEYIKGWNPKYFNADEWADVFEEAGFKYMVFVSKHHDGFAMFDSKANNYSISKHTAFKRDPFKELCTAVQGKGMKTGFYYSHGTDWRNKIGLTGTPQEIDMKYFEATVKPHLEELSTNYGEQIVAWFDLGWKDRAELAQTCIDILRRNNPNILISSRIGSGLGDFTAERDAYIPPIPKDGNWETCMTFNDHWDWTASDKTQKSYQEIIRMLASVRARGGNMLLNVGPDVRGCIPLKERTTLKQVGLWLEKHGESIYGVQKTPYPDLPWGVCTHKPGTLYLQIMEMPSLDYLFLPGLQSKISNAYYLADPSKKSIDFEEVAGGWNITLETAGIPAEVFDVASTVVAVEYEGELTIDPTPVLDHDLDNRFIVPLAKIEYGASFEMQRITPVIDHPGVLEPDWEEFACGFSNKDAEVSWEYNLYKENRFCINVEYANLTGRKLNAIINIGGKIHELELQPTNSKTNPWSMFTLTTSGSEVLEPGTGQVLSFKLDKDNALEDLDEQYVTPIKRETGLKKFMLKSVVLKPFYPLPYEGYTPKNSSAVTHQAVEGEPLSEEYSVTVNGKNVPVYTARVDELYRKSPLKMDDSYSFASFECSGSVEVVVRSGKPLSSFSIRPNGEDIPVNLKGHEATFVLERNGNFLIERNGNGRKDPLLLFANPLEVNPPQAGDPDLIYFGPGRHNPGLIELSSNQTLYIHGGAIVTGRVVAQGDNIKIIGRGLLENSGEEYYGKYMILLDSCRNVKVEGIVLRKNNRGWTLVPKYCDEVIVSNVKICGSFYGNDDGIDPVNTRNMLIEDCLIRTKDDCLAFKGMDNGLSNCENITVNRTTMWSDQCCTILLGDESRATFMRNITIKNCFVPYLSYEGYPKKFLMLHSGEDMRMENLLFENIEIGGEGQERNYIEMSCEFNRYSKTKTAGHIRNLLLKNVHLTGKEGPYNIVIKGYDKSHGIEDLTFENCTINGKLLTKTYPNLQIGEFTKDIKFTSQ